MKQWLLNILYSFPVQLFLMHLKKQQILLFFWLLLWGFIVQSFGSKLGIPYLFLDPEYLNRVGFLSFMIMGGAFSGMIMTWNITSYILHSFRFPFLATLSRPFAKFCINNTIIPGIILITYMVKVIQFQLNQEMMETIAILINLAGFASGFILMIVVLMTWFFSTNKNIARMFGIQPEDKEGNIDPPAREWMDMPKNSSFTKMLPVKYYLSSYFKVRLTRSVKHYSEAQISTVFRQNHINAMIIEFLAFVSLITLGYLVDYAIFRIPAGASILLLLSILIMLIGAFSFWLRGWRTTIFIILLFLANFIIRFNLIQYDNQAYGLDYQAEKTVYSREMLQNNTTQTDLTQDKNQTLQILENWHKKAMIHTPKGQKPKIVFLNATGGGSRSAVWTFKVMQSLDSMMQGNLMDHTMMISGASAGMLSAAYYRELHLQNKMGQNLQLNDRAYLEHIGRDMLNSISFTWVVNDMFYLWHKFEYNNLKYQKDRGYMFERQFNENTNHLLDKPLSDYTQPEQEAVIPMMVLGPTVVNDGRRLLISSQAVSYLTRPSNMAFSNQTADIDGVEFKKLFKNSGAENLRFTSALRMNATFPYISPEVTLPSQPVMEIMDAGMRDNFGIQTTVRFLNVFKDWINENTDGVVIIQIRDTEKLSEIPNYKSPTILDKLLNPIESFYANWSTFQEYYHDNLIEYSSSWFNGNLDIVSFEYRQKNEEDRVSLSWHLTKQEKKTLIQSMNEAHNQEAMEQLEKLFTGYPTIATQ